MSALPHPPATRHRTPVVLLHALSLHASMWEAQESALRARGHQVLAVDQRGFGRAPLGTVPPSLDAVADDLARTLDEHGMDRAVLAGSSMGGYAAMAFLRRFPGRVAGLALLAARATADDPEAAAGRLRFAELVQDPERRAALVDRVTPLLLSDTTRARRPDLVARVLADAHAADPAALAWAQRAVAARPDSTAVLRAARIPALVVAGGQDALVTPLESRHVADLLPQGRLITLAHAGHLQPLEAPDEVTRALCGLLDEVDVTAALQSGARAC
ncbi:alpha/beta fold hydrolase [Streptomyces sp. NBC_00083]|uniref:alpha/beta fold hydrolase n=1 Tax=Streptomyces sp. NBC_00083 TaxID=2975647 RepID=UPI00224F3246|nr:alpha/beta hydrolase [Streptomyces sp. NBC_00083]MCX5388040.1 alpha/beta hydrolase [Streptomyces sp. NBC_00083]